MRQGRAGRAVSNRAGGEPTGPFIPTCRADLEQRGWDGIDVLFVSGDAYIDHPAFGVPLLARLLEAEGYRVGLLAQPDWRQAEAFQVLGRPRLFAAVAAGAMDSMVAHYTAARKVRRDDAYTPGGRAGARPNRAVIAYTAALKGAFKGLPVVIGGIEASLRRLAHYDYWDDGVRRSILVDSKAALLVHGMAELSLLEVARRCALGEEPGGLRDVSGTAFLSEAPPSDAVLLPSFAEVREDTEAYGRAFRLAVEQANPFCGRPLAQEHDGRWVVVLPPARPLTTLELDRIYSLPFLRRPHPAYLEPIPAFAQIRHSITSHRGCCGGCAFCAIALHQGKIIQSRSAESILAEAEHMAGEKGFSGTLTDIGGPTANMYGMSCADPESLRNCRRLGCLWPEPCRNLHIADDLPTDLLRRLRNLAAVRHVFVASGVRTDLLPRQPRYLRQLLSEHVGGLLKVAPETLCGKVARVMRKPGPEVFERFLEEFRATSVRLDRRQAVVPYLMAGHPGCTLDDMVETALFLRRHGLRVEQVQEFTPTPGTLATCIYHTGRDPLTGETLYVARTQQERRRQKALLLWHRPENRENIRLALQACGRLADARELLAPVTGARRPKLEDGPGFRPGPPRRKRRGPA
jgi:uncharacterized radical SAM protein YgiQ